MLIWTVSWNDGCSDSTNEYYCYWSGYYAKRHGWGITQAGKTTIYKNDFI